MADSIRGECELCHESCELQDSHILSAFLYKRFVSDKSGRFIDARRGPTGKQYTDYLFCSSCEKGFSANETHAAQLIRRFRRDQTKSVEYSETFLQFLAGTFYRVVIYIERNNSLRAPSLQGAKQVWRDYLLEKRHNVGVHSLHAFLFRDTPQGHHGMLYWDYQHEHGLMVAQLGPILCFGKAASAIPCRRERGIIEQSRVRKSGGVISPIQTWTVGRNVTKAMVSILAFHETIAMCVANDLNALNDPAVQRYLESL
jgi:hypothetical protein